MRRDVLAVRPSDTASPGNNRYSIEVRNLTKLAIPRTRDIRINIENLALAGVVLKDKRTILARRHFQ